MHCLLRIVSIWQPLIFVARDLLDAIGFVESLDGTQFASLFVWKTHFAAAKTVNFMRSSASSPSIHKMESYILCSPSLRWLVVDVEASRKLIVADGAGLL